MAGSLPLSTATRQCGATVGESSTLTDSGAVVIGAMLIAPLMNPMLAMATALVRGWPTREAEQLAIVTAGVVLAVATGFVISMLVPHELTANSLPTQITSRTNPSLVDLAIAVAAGAALILAGTSLAARGQSAGSSRSTRA